MNLFNSNLSGWESDVKNSDSDGISLGPKSSLGFNCNIPFTKNCNNQYILFEFSTNKYISLALSILDDTMQVVKQQENSFNTGEYAIKLNIENLPNTFFILNVKSIGKFIVKKIQLI